MLPALLLLSLFTPDLCLAIPQSPRLERLPGPEPVVKQVELKIHLRTAHFYRAPAAAEVEVEVRFSSERPTTEEIIHPTAVPVATVRTDHHGYASCLLDFPLSDKGNLKNGYLYFRPISAQWSYIPDSIRLCPGKLDSKLCEIEVSPGAPIAIQLLGIPEKSKRLDSWRNVVTLQRLDKNSAPIFGYHFRAPGVDQPLTTYLQVKESGNYRVFVHGLAGVGYLDRIYIDAHAPPEKLEIRMESLGTIAGHVEIPAGYPKQGLEVLALADFIPTPRLVADAYAAAPKQFPALFARAAVNEHGDFLLQGLAHTTYRLGYSSGIFPGQPHGWFVNEAVTPNTKEVGLALTMTQLILNFETEFPQAEAMSWRERPKVDVLLVQEAKKDFSQFIKIKSVRGPDGRHGYPLLPDMHYRILVSGKGYPVWEHDITPLGNEEYLEIQVPWQPRETGRLLWDGPDWNLFTLCSEKSKTPLDSWFHRMHKREPIKKLAPGRYLLRVEGINQTTCGSNYYDSRTRWGATEQWIEIFPNTETTVSLSPPKVGWIELHLAADGQPNPGQVDSDVFPKLQQVDFGKVHFHENEASFVMRRLQDGLAYALTTTVTNTVAIGPQRLEPGKSVRPLEVFEPGDYELEVRVPGFPLQHLPVTIRAHEWTDVSICLKGI